jgi:predicted transport protein
MAYTSEMLFRDNYDSKPLYPTLRDKILAIDKRITENPTKSYIGFKIGNLNIVKVEVYQYRLVVGLNRVEPEDLDDPKKAVKYQEFSMAYYNKHISDFSVRNVEDIEYAIFLIRQVYDKFFKD